MFNCTGTIFERRWKCAHHPERESIRSFNALLAVRMQDHSYWWWSSRSWHLRGRDDEKATSRYSWGRHRNGKRIIQYNWKCFLLHSYITENESIWSNPTHIQLSHSKSFIHFRIRLRRLKIESKNSWIFSSRSEWSPFWN